MRPLTSPTVAALAALLTASAISSSAIGSARLENEPSGPSAAPVPVEDYPIYNQVIVTKFLTSQTSVVLIDKLTANRLQPAGPPVSHTYFEDNPIFNNTLPEELVSDFVMKNVLPSSLEAEFNLGVRYRLVSGDDERQEVVAAQPVRWIPSGVRCLPESCPLSTRRIEQGGPETVGRLVLSRVAYARNLALVYAAEERRDGTGGGFFVLLERVPAGWTIVDTEVLWVSRREVPAQE
jgi:hypothetical protein